MKSFKFFPLYAFLFFLLCSLSSCQAIAGIFGAGFKLGIWIAVIVVILIIVGIVKIAGGKK